jgi:hypothetical protein
MANLASTSTPLENLCIRTLDGDDAEDTSLLALANGRKLVVGNMLHNLSLYISSEFA